MNTVGIPSWIWREVRDFFAQIVSPCQTCVYGNPIECWESRCAAFKFRPIARDVMSVNTKAAPALPHYVQIEEEIIDVLSRFNRPVLPSMIKLRTTCSKAVKSKAITRLVKRGKIVEEKNGYSRFISLPKKEKQ